MAAKKSERKNPPAKTLANKPIMPRVHGQTLRQRLLLEFKYLQTECDRLNSQVNDFLRRLGAVYAYNAFYTVSNQGGKPSVRFVVIKEPLVNSPKKQKRQKS